MKQIVVGVSGATGIILAYKLVDFLTRTENNVHLVMSRAACKTAQYELGDAYASPSLWKKRLSQLQQKHLHCHSIHDIGSPLASGTYPTDGMIVLRVTPVSGTAWKHAVGYSQPRSRPRPTCGPMPL